MATALPCHPRHDSQDRINDELVLSGTSPEAVVAALGWFAMTCCQMTIPDLKTRGLPGLLPQQDQVCVLTVR